MNIIHSRTILCRESGEKLFLLRRGHVEFNENAPLIGGLWRNFDGTDYRISIGPDDFLFPTSEATAKGLMIVTPDSYQPLFNLQAEAKPQLTITPSMMWLTEVCEEISANIHIPVAVACASDGRELVFEVDFTDEGRPIRTVHVSVSEPVGMLVSIDPALFVDGIWPEITELFG